MDQNLATATVVLDTRKIKKNGKFPLKLRVTHNRKSKYFAVPLPDFELEEWQKFTAGKTRGEAVRELKKEIQVLEVRAADKIKEIEDFSFDRFKSLMWGPKLSKADLFEAMEAYKGKLKKEERYGTAGTVDAAIKSLKAFNTDKKFKGKMEFSTVTVKYLTEYAAWMGSKNKSNTTVGIYLRALQAVFNLAIDQGAVKPAAYPFGKRKFKIPASRNVKKTLTLKEVKKINKFPLIAGSYAEKAKDYWMFSYLQGGINVKDMLNLKWGDVNGDSLTYVRQKTKRTAKVQEPINLFLMPQAKEIIERQGSDKRGPDDFIFPVLNKSMDPEKAFKRTKDFTKFINNWMKKIAEELGIDKPVTTYTARHSYATIMMQSGASVAMISKAIGHGGNIRTTLNYMGDFELEEKKGFSLKLI